MSVENANLDRRNGEPSKNELLDLFTGLQARVDALEDQQESTEQMVDARLNAVMKQIETIKSDVYGSRSPAEDEVEELDAVLAQLADLKERVGDTERSIDDVDERVSEIDGGTPKSENDAWNRLVEQARNLKDQPEHMLSGQYDVALFVEDVVAATGWSNKWASEQIETYGERMHGATWAPYQRASQHNKGNAKKKRLKIDLDVHD